MQLEQQSGGQANKTMEGDCDVHHRETQTSHTYFKLTQNCTSTVNRGEAFQSTGQPPANTETLSLGSCGCSSVYKHTINLCIRLIYFQIPKTPRPIALGLLSTNVQILGKKKRFKSFNTSGDRLNVLFTVQFKFQHKPFQEFALL